jgi:hypothetical protein
LGRHWDGPLGSEKYTRVFVLYVHNPSEGRTPEEAPRNQIDSMA